MLQEQSKLFQRILFFADFALVVLAWIAAYFVRFELFARLAPYFPRLTWLPPPVFVPFGQYLWLLPWVLIAAAFVFYSTGLYAPDRALRFLRLVYSVTKAVAFGLIIVAALFTFYRAISVSRIFLLLFGLFVAVFMIGLRLVLYTWFRTRRHRHLRRVLIVGAGRVGRRLEATFRQYPWMGIEVVGFLDDRKVGEPGIIGETAAATGLLDKFQMEGRPIHHVYLALPLSAASRIEALMSTLSNRLAHVYLVPDIFGYEVLNARVSDLDGMPVIHLIDEVPLRLAWVGKRIFDIVFSASFLLLASPVLLVIALAVKLSSPGPVFYKQERVSLNGHRFGMLKFRSMRTDGPGDVVLLTAKDDPRVTKVGRFLRNTSLDELPQFINVLKGDMSIVGPRPERSWVVDEVRTRIPRYMLKHKVPAGITGWAQVHGWRGNTSLEKRIEYDLYYIQNWSFKLDLKIVLMTIWKGFVNENAY